MRKANKNLRLVSSNDPTSIFDDLEALREQSKVVTTHSRRRRSTETFARVPHDHALALYRHIGGRTG